MKLWLDRNRPVTFLTAALRDRISYEIEPRRVAEGLWRGFSPTQIRYHALERTNMAAYFPDRDRYLITLNTNRHVWPILHDKLLFDSFMRSRLPITEASCVFVDGAVTPLEPGFDLAELIERVIAGQVFVVKPVQGGKGIGVRRLAANQGALRIGDERIALEDGERLWSSLDYHLVVPFIHQHQALSDLFPRATNTLRLTIYKPLGRSPRLFAPVLRVGTERSAPMDNYSQGGLLCALDAQTGTVWAACRRTEDRYRETLERHPDTGVALVGLKVPFWSDIVRRLLEFHETHPAFDLVGWDVLVGEDGWTIIEGNHNPDLDLPFSFTTRSAHPEFDAFLRGLYARQPPEPAAAPPRARHRAQE